MSLRIDVDDVEAVLIAGRWYEVLNQSFDLDAYEFMEDRNLIFTGGDVDTLSSTGYYFITGTSVKPFTLKGPVTAIQAVRTKAS